MPWAAAIAGAAVLGGAAISSNASKSAANTQANAANAANAVQKDQYGQTVDRNQPFVSGGSTAFNSLVNRLGLSHIPTAQDVQNEPGYQFGLDQGQNQLNRQLNAKGMNYSGAQLKAAARYGNDYATTKYDDAFTRDQQADQQSYNQAFGLARIGQASANNTAAAGENFANTTGNNLMGAANSQAANSLAQGNIANNALNQGVSAYRNYQAPATTGGYQTAPTQTYTDGGEYYGHADGGPILSEPVVGSRSPLPAGGGGGAMSKQAIIAALLQSVPQQPQRSGIGALPANPLTSPGAIVQNQMQQAGAYQWGGSVKGPGTQTSDSIPAYLSNGEHVMDAASVTALGDGDNARGQNMLNQVRRKLKARG